MNWLLQQPTVDNIIIGTRNEQQLKQNLEAVGKNLTTDQVKRLDAVCDSATIYPSWHQWLHTFLNTVPQMY